MLNARSLFHKWLGAPPHASCSVDWRLRMGSWLRSRAGCREFFSTLLVVPERNHRIDLGRPARR